MSENTKIEWADHTFNPWIGCTAISPGCTNCYAADWAKRYGKDFANRSRTKTWGDPVRWNKQHTAFFAEHGRRQRVFCASLADVFDNEVSRQWRQDLFDVILVTPNLDWLLLTKRIGNAAGMLQDIAEYRGALMDSNDRYRPLPNVMIGATIVNQEEADRDIPKLLAVPAAKRFLSMEPLLDHVDINKWLAPWTCSNCGHHGSESESGPCVCDDCGVKTVYDKSDGSDHCPVCKKADEDPGVGFACPVCERASNWDHDYCLKFDRERPLDWVIVGGESGPGARPMHPDWARSLRDQCEAAGVPFLFKQWGEWLPTSSGDICRSSTAPEHAAFRAKYGRGGYEFAGKEGRTILRDGRTCISQEGGSIWQRPAGKVIDAEAMARFRDYARSGQNDPGYQWMHAVGKKAAGRALDGITHDGYPS